MHEPIFERRYIVGIGDIVMTTRGKGHVVGFNKFVPPGFYWGEKTRIDGIYVTIEGNTIELQPNEILEVIREAEDV